MGPAGTLRVAPGIEIPVDEIRIEYTRSGGPGGQNVNKVESCAVVRFSPATSRALSAEQRARVIEDLGPRLTKAGDLVLRCTEHSTRERNTEAGLARLARLLAEALQPRKTRRATRPTYGSRQRRLAAKRHAQGKKHQRRTVEDE